MLINKQTNMKFVPIIRVDVLHSNDGNDDALMLYNNRHLSSRSVRSRVLATAFSSQKPSGQ